MRKDSIEKMTHEIYTVTGTYWPSINQIATLYLHTRGENVKQLMQGVKCRKDGRAYRFRAEDVAIRLYESEEIYGGLRWTPYKRAE